MPAGRAAGDDRRSRAATMTDAGRRPVRCGRSAGRMRRPAAG